VSATPTTPERKRQTRVRSNHLGYALAILALQGRDCTTATLINATGLHRSTVIALLRSFHKFDLIHVASWLPDSMGRESTPVYRWGVGIDASRRRTNSVRRTAQSRERAQQRAAA